MAKKLIFTSDNSKSSREKNPVPLSTRYYYFNLYSHTLATDGKTASTPPPVAAAEETEAALAAHA